MLIESDKNCAYKRSLLWYSASFNTSLVCLLCWFSIVYSGILHLLMELC